jgi:hypothetical protein
MKRSDGLRTFAADAFLEKIRLYSLRSPRFTEVLAKQFEKMGGIRYMFLTHQDDVADHAKWAARFRCERILHSEEVRHSFAELQSVLSTSEDCSQSAASWASETFETFL